MLDVASKAFFQTLSYSRTLKTLASRYGMSGTRAFAPALHRRRNRRRCDRGGSPHPVAGAALHARLSRRKRHVAGGGRHRHARVSAADRRGRSRGRRAQPVAQADAARPRRRPRDLRRQPAEDSDGGRAVRLLRPHRHGELGVYGCDARHLRDGLEARASQRGRRAAIVPVPHGEGFRARERAGRAHQAGEGRVPRAEERRVSAEVGRGCGLRAAREAPAHRRDLPRDRDARRGDSGRGEALRRGSRDPAGRLRVPDALRHSPRSAERAFATRATACACMCPSAANGFPTSCAGSANGRPTSAFVVRSLFAER